jgi:ABC-2 type transport system ATP-binding protein
MIQIEHVQKSFKEKQVLRDVSLTCEQGKIQALLGINGAGKTTLIHIISQLLKAEQGTFSIDGESVTDDSYLYKRKVGYVFEAPMYAEKFTAYEYLDFVSKLYQLPKSVAKERIEELLLFFELENENKKSIQRFSKGMKSKISLAASLIHSPKYLIYDEPFDGIDFLMSQKLIRLFKEMAAKGITFLITSHQFELIADMADNFAILKDGKILFNRPYQDICVDVPAGSNIKDHIQSLMQLASNRQNINYLTDF